MRTCIAGVGRKVILSRDILLLTRIDKPALLRQLFRLGCDYSGQVLSYQKTLGQLQDAGHTTTLAHYLELLAGAGMLTGLQKFSAARVRQRGSSAVGVHLSTTPSGTNVEVFYWRERGREVDFVLRAGRRVAVVEVASGRPKDTMPGMETFDRVFRPNRKLLVGGQGIPLEEFLLRPAQAWVD